MHGWTEAGELVVLRGNGGSSCNDRPLNNDSRTDNGRDQSEQVLAAQSRTGEGSDRNQCECECETGGGRGA